jgi:hypothetical protein
MEEPVTTKMEAPVTTKMEAPVTTQQTNTLPKKKTQKKKNAIKKRSRQTIVMDEQKSYCDRLLHQCRKDLHKHAKVCKNFECQKLIRKGNTTEQILSTWRNLPLEPVLQECFRRLGALDLLETTPKKDTPASDEAVDVETIERILQHKRMREALEQWSVKVTEYRKWCSRHLEKNQTSSQTSRKKQKKAPEVAADTAPGDNSLFVTLNEDEDDGEDDDGDDDDEEKEKKTKVPYKKKRAGQKVRKAKFIETQRLLGIEPVPRRPKARNESNKNAPAPKQEEEELHPSWEARKSLKSSIVAFQGKKITFG